MSIHNFYRIYFTILVLISFCMMIWLTYPTQFLLRSSQAELATNGFWGNCVWMAYQYITPWNACPSFHIAISWFILRTMNLYLKKNLWLFHILFYAIAASTVFIRIHYIADVVFGILIAELAVNVLLRNLEKYKAFNNLSKRNFIFSYIGILMVLSSLFLLFAHKLTWMPI